MRNTEEQLIQFIRDEIGEFKKQIDSFTQIENELGITGDEAIELIENISKKFNVDISAFDFKKYFYPEPRFFNKYGKVEPLTIQNIQDSIISGKLV